MKNKHLNKIKGDFGEELACKFLRDNGYEILTRNYKNYFGEIDIIAKYKRQIIFIEVKTRTNLNYGEEIEAINRYKKRHIENTAKVFIKQNKLEKFQISFDAIQILKNKNSLKIKYVKQIF